MPTIAINQVNYYYELHGSGHPLVLISGYCCDHLLWLPLLDQLSKQFQVLLIDNRGIGQTQDQGEAFTVASQAADIMMICEQLGLHQPHVVGHSMGGMIAQTIAAQYPNQIDRLVIMSSTAKLRLAPLMAFKVMLAMREQSVNFDLIFEVMLPWVFGQKFLSDPKNLELLKRMYLENPMPQSIEGQTRQYEALKQFDGRSQLTNIKAKTLIVYGKQDIISLVEESVELARHIANASTEVLDCAHGLVSEVPQSVGKILQSFLTAG